MRKLFNYKGSEKDGISTGFPVGVIFASSYTAHVDKTVVREQQNLKPLIYCNDIDDSFLLCRSCDELQRSLSAFRIKTSLNFTYKFGQKNQVNSLDVTIKQTQGAPQTSVYSKPTNPGFFLNANSEGPATYQEGTIKALVHGSFKLSSEFAGIKRLKNTLVNNRNSSSSFDAVFNQRMNKICEESPQTQNSASSNGREINTVFYKTKFKQASLSKY